MEHYEFLHGASILVGAIASVLALYVTVRLAKFKDELIKEINGTYVKSALWAEWRKTWESLVERLRHFRDHDYSDERTAMLLRMQRVEDKVAAERDE